MKQKDIDLQVFDTARIDRTNRNGVVYRRSDSEVIRYKIRIFVDGNDLPFVRQVTYRLHKTFRNPIRVVKRTTTNPNCRLELWTWGVFEITADVLDSKGQLFQFTHSLSYGKELEELDSKLFRKVK